MKSLLKWIIALVTLSVFFIVIFPELDSDQFFKWEVITIVILGVTVLLFMKWRRSMCISENEVCIQFLDD